MRWSLRLILSAFFLVSIPLFLVTRHFADIWDQYSISSYIAASWQNTFRYGNVENIPAFDNKLSDKVIIMAKLEKENTDWVTEELPEYVPPSSSVWPPANTLLQLASSNIHRQPDPQYYHQQPHHPPQQRPRSHGLPHLHN